MRSRQDDKINKETEFGGGVRQQESISPRPSAHLPQSLGNQDVTRLLQTRDRRSPSTIQRKPLEVSHPTDSDEKEADEVARKVLDGQTAQVHGRGVIVNRSGGGPTEPTPHFRSKLENSKGRGQPLDDSTRSEMESQMGADFSGVSIHTDGNAVDMNRQVRAKAFTEEGTRGKRCSRFLAESIKTERPGVVKPGPVCFGDKAFSFNSFEARCVDNFA